MAGSGALNLSDLDSQLASPLKCPLVGGFSLLPDPVMGGTSLKGICDLRCSDFQSCNRGSCDVCADQKETQY